MTCLEIFVGCTHALKELKELNTRATLTSINALQHSILTVVVAPNHNLNNYCCDVSLSHLLILMPIIQEYLYSCPIIDNIMLPSDYLDCLLEIRDFNLSNQKEHRVDRLQLILHRYTALNLPMLGLISNKFDAKPGKYSDPSMWPCCLLYCATH